MLEAALISQDKHRLAHLAENGHKNAVVMRALLSRTDRLLAAVLLCNNLSNVTCATAATAMATRLFTEDATVLLLVTLAVTFIILVFSEVTPKVIGVRYAQPISLACARPLRGLVRLLVPFVYVANFFSSLLLLAVGLRHRSRFLNEAMNIKELLSVIRAAGRAGTAENSAHYNMMEKTLLFNEMPVEKIMTPRPDICGIDIRQADDAIARDVLEAAYSKLPLYDGNIDEVKGVIDVMTAIKKSHVGRLSAADLLAAAEPPLLVPAAAAALQQLQNMRAQRRRLAFVIDGGGRIVGLLTFANFAAAIIGEETPPLLSYRGGGVMDAPADMAILQLESQFAPWVSPPTTANSLNGLILEYLGDLPKTSVCLNINGLKMEILAVDDKSIRRVRLFSPQQKDDEK